MASSIASASVAGDSTRSSSRIVPSSSTTPPAILVPPTSIPQASVMRRPPRASRRRRVVESSSSRSMCSTPAPSRVGAGGRQQPGGGLHQRRGRASARWARTSGLVWRTACTVRQTGQQVHSAAPVATCSSSSSRRPSPSAQSGRGPPTSSDAPRRRRCPPARGRVRGSRRLVRLVGWLTASPPVSSHGPSLEPHLQLALAPRGRRRPGAAPARRAG